MHGCTLIHNSINRTELSFLILLVILGIESTHPQLKHFPICERLYVGCVCVVLLKEPMTEEISIIGRFGFRILSASSTPPPTPSSAYNIIHLHEKLFGGLGMWQSRPSRPI